MVRYCSSAPNRSVALTFHPHRANDGHGNLKESKFPERQDKGNAKINSILRRKFNNVKKRDCLLLKKIIPSVRLSYFCFISILEFTRFVIFFCCSGSRQTYLFFPSKYCSRFHKALCLRHHCELEAQTL
jgi:hypothetical protein